MYAYVGSPSLSDGQYIYVCVCMYVCICIYIYMIYIYIYMYVYYAYTCMHICARHLQARDSLSLSVKTM